jgi:hypothetical protein
MIRAFHRTPFLPFCALLVLTGSLSLSLVSQLHDLSDDELSGPALVLHDESAHRILATKPVHPSDQHCFICHWLQSLRTVEATVVVITPGEQTGWLDATVARSASAAPFQQLPARAPPLA